MWPSRAFLCGMIDLLCCFRTKDHPIRLNQEFHCDLLWWHQFLDQWHGVSYWLFPGLSPTMDLEISLDAAGSLGFGAFFQGQWFYGSWALPQQLQSIAYKALFPVANAAFVWGPQWCKRHVLLCTDNDAVVHMLNSRTLKIPCLMRLLRHLLLSAARHSFSFSAQHVPGVNNQLADALSRFHWQDFHLLAPDSSSSTAPDGLNLASLEQQCFSFMTQGLAPSTRNSYTSAQRKFISFCHQLGKLHPTGSLTPTDEWTFCLFTTFLANTIQCSSIKVYLSAVRALHIDQGFPDPLQNCHHLCHVIRGIKRSWNSPSSNRLPITDSLMLVIWRSLDTHIPYPCMFWVTCTLGYFGFLRAAEFTVASLASFSPLLHLTVLDIAVYAPSSPLCMRIKIKASKTDPFHKGSDIHISLGRHSRCAVQAMMAYLSQRGTSPVPLFCLQDGRPLSCGLLTQWLRQIMAAAGIAGNFSSHSFCYWCRHSCRSQWYSRPPYLSLGAVD